MISHEHRVIFVHIPKAAGQSIEQTFLTNLGLSWDQRGSLLLQRNADPTRGPGFLAHLYALEYLQLGYVTPEQFASYLKFAVVREPWDRFLSGYRYRNPTGRASLADFFARRAEAEHLNAARHAVPQHRYAYDGDTLLLDHVLRFETLSDEWPAMSERIFGEVVPLPHANPGRRPSREPAYDAAVRRGVEERYQRDYALFGYPLTT